MTGLTPAVAVAVAVALVALSAFFVAVEFALVAARRYRLEEAADSRARTLSLYQTKAEALLEAVTTYLRLAQQRGCSEPRRIAAALDELRQACASRVGEPLQQVIA